MIKLTLQPPRAQSTTQTFQKKLVAIGTASSDGQEPDLLLTELQHGYLTIEEVDGNFVALNVANDPFTSINGLPFRKKRLKTGDSIEIGSTRIEFEGIANCDALPNEELPYPQQPKIEPTTAETNAVANEQALCDIKNQIQPTVQQPPKSSQPKSPLLTTAPAVKRDIFALLKRVEELDTASLSAVSNSNSTKIEMADAPIRNEVITLPIAEELDDPDDTDDANCTDSASLLTASVTDTVRLSAETPSKPLAAPLTASKTAVSANSTVNDNAAPRRHRSLKDDYLRDLDDEHDDDNASKRRASKAVPRFVISWKTLVTLLAGLLIFCSAAFAIFYVSITDRSEKEEIKVAAAVADVVMALNFAQLNNALPQNQNWSDPDFLKHILSAVLAKGYFPLANVDSHGQFHGSSYILRIYTSSDLSHFLVIAQPNANLLQWLVPKSAIIVDSQLMELRKSNDLRILNRLLIDPTLDSTNSAEIAHLVGQGQLITLEKLNLFQKNAGFTSPKALAFIRPGAENLIYNALRYYNFGESLTKKAVALYESRDNQQDTAHLMQEIDALMKLKSIVLYTSGGLQTAIAAQKAIATFMPSHKFLFGYLQLNANGLARSSHLLMDDTTTVIVDPTKKTDSFALIGASELQHALTKQSNAAASHEDETPLDRLLPELNKERESALSAIEESINELIDGDDLSAPNFSNKLNQLRQEYSLTAQKYQDNIVKALGLLSTATWQKGKQGKIMALTPPDSTATQRFSPINLPSGSASSNNLPPHQIEKKHPLYYKLAALYDAQKEKIYTSNGKIPKLIGQGSEELIPLTFQRIDLSDSEGEAAAEEDEMEKTIFREISDLYNTYPYMPLTEFMSYVKASKLEPFLEENLKKQLQNESERPFSQKLFDSQIEKIHQASTLQALNDSVVEASRMLTIKDVSDTNLLIDDQNAVRWAVIQKLDLFLLSPEQQLKPEELQAKNRVMLENILQRAWINDEDELDYYMNEFDLLTI